MKKILALASKYPTAKRPTEFPIIRDQLMALSLKTDITLLYIYKVDNQDKYIQLDVEEINSNFRTIKVSYIPKTKSGPFYKLRWVMEMLRVGRMACDVLLKNNLYDQVHVHYSWPMIMLGRELLMKHKLALFIFLYDINYIYLEYRRNNPVSFLSYVANLFAMQSVRKVFGPTPAMIHKASRKYQIKDKVVILPFAVDTDYFHFNQGDIKNKQIYISINAITKEYFPMLEDEIAAILNAYPQYCIVCGCRPDDFPYFKNLYEKYKNRFIEVDSSNQMQKSHALNSSEIAAIINESNNDPSIFNQALCSGCFVVASPIVSFAKDLEPDTGCIFSPSDIGDFTKKVISAIKNPKDPVHISEVGKRNFGQHPISSRYYEDIKYY